MVRRVAQLLGPSTPGPQTDRVLRARTPAMEGPTPAMESPRILEDLGVVSYLHPKEGSGLGRPSRVDNPDRLARLFVWPRCAR